MLWIASAGFILGGVAATALSLLQPPQENGLRVAATCLGLMLTSAGGVLASYGITRSATAREQEAAYHAYLSGVARSIAHVYSTLHEVTENRRSQVYAHEETYLECVIMSAEELLTQFDGLTRFSGSIGSDLVDSKAELNTIRRGLFEHSATETVDAVVSLVQRSEKPTAERVVVKCPRCGSRVPGALALRAGWTAQVGCANCGLRFNIHRRPDMSVYASPNKESKQEGLSAAPNVAELGTSPEPSAGQRTIEARNEDEPHWSPMPGRAHAHVDVEARTRKVLVCPNCRNEISVNLPSQPKSGRSEFVRSCLTCRIFLMINTDDFAISTQPAEFSRGEIVARWRAFPVVACASDKFPVHATFHAANDEDWYAVCVQHRTIMGVARSEYRTWLEAHDPDFLRMRLQHERSGGKRVISDSDEPRIDEHEAIEL